MTAARTDAASSPSRAVWIKPFNSGGTVSFAALANSGPFDVALAVTFDVERGDLVFAVDVGQGLDRGPETADSGAGQVADGEALLDQGLAALEINAIVDG